MPVHPWQWENKLAVDAAGKPMVSALIERSGLEAGEWLQRYFEAYLVPLVHCLYRYDATRQNTRNWPPGLPGMTCSPQISSSPA